MAELITQILNARSKEREFKNNIKKLESEIESLAEEIEYSEKTLDEKVASAADTYVQEQQEIVKEDYAPKVDELEDDIAKLQELLGSKNVEDTEELIEAKETREYLNGAAIMVNRYYLELKKISSTYFIDLAYNEQHMKKKAFKKAFESLNNRVQDLEAMRTNLTQPFRYVEANAKKKSTNYSIYLSATLMSWWVTALTPFALIKAVKRARYLHSSASLYHKMMHTLVTLRKKSDEEISSIFSSLLELKSQKLQKELDAKQEELDDLNSQLSQTLDLIAFDEDSFRGKQGMQIGANRIKLGTLNAQLSKFRDALEEILDLLERLTGERSDSLEQERESFLQGREERSVVLPTQLLYDWTLDSNSYFELNHGLYLFSERDTVSSFLQMFIFQLRNIMEWGSVQFRILDLLGAEFVAPLILPASGKAKAQDIAISTLKEEREQLVELMHDLLVRRKTQILQTVSNLGDYNLIQQSAGSSPMPYQIIFIILTENLKMDEKLIQLIHNGEKLGLLVFIFMKDELFTLQVAKSVEPYFNSIVELSDTGLSSYDPNTYLSILEQKEADRKSRI